MSVSELSKKTETWTDEIEKLVAKKVIHSNPTTILNLVHGLMAGEVTHDEFEQRLLNLKFIELKYLTETEKQQASIRQATADWKRLESAALEIAGSEREPSRA